jgi:hypothetical protein
MAIHTFPRHGTDPEKLMDACVENVEGFRSGAYHGGLDAFLADENHGRISWDDDYIWVEARSSITRDAIQFEIDAIVLD